MIHGRSDCIYHTSIFDPDYSAISLLPWIHDNKPLFDLKNDDIGPKSGPKLNIDSTISVTWLGSTPATPIGDTVKRNRCQTLNSELKIFYSLFKV
jgi:hypothetical protein